MAKREATESGALLPKDAGAEMQRFVDLLARWNRSINLVSRGDMPGLWTRHIADSLQLERHWVARPERAIDLGSGAGFPGLVLAIKFGIPFDLIEQDQSKAAFLREAARETGARVTVHATKIETASVSPATLVVARGLAPLVKLLTYAEKLLTPDGKCLFLKSRGVEAEIAEARRHWCMRVEPIPSVTDGNGVILRVSELARA
jgi:16S rRNA (guanine527-N7)-methyltransferase